MASCLKALSSASRSLDRVSKKALFAIIFYLLVPTFAILMIMAAYPELSRESLTNMLLRTVPIAVALVLVSQYGVRYEKGDKRRFVLNEIYVLLVLFWLLALFGGEPIIHQTWGEHAFTLNIWNYVLLIFFVSCVNAVYFALEYWAYGKNAKSEEPGDGTSHEATAEKEDVAISAQ
jgi:hypothetical protein